MQYVLKPTFTKQHIAGLDKQGKLYRAYDGTTYLPGIVGLNNIKANDYANVVLQVYITVPVDILCAAFEIRYRSMSLSSLCFQGFFQCSTTAKLLPGGRKLQGNPQTTRGHHVPLGAEVWWADAQTLESKELQGPCVSPWDATGCGTLQQEEFPNHQARSDLCSQTTMLMKSRGSIHMLPYGDNYRLSDWLGLIDCPFCRRCCGLHDVVFKCSAWRSGRHEEKAKWVVGL